MNKKPDQLKSSLQYELVLYPLSLFSAKDMQKNTKLKLYGIFDPLPELPKLDDYAYVVNGGMLMNKVQWRLDEKMPDILQCYVK